MTMTTAICTSHLRVGQESVNILYSIKIVLVAYILKAETSCTVRFVTNLVPLAAAALPHHAVFIYFAIKIQKDLIIMATAICTSLLRVGQESVNILYSIKIAFVAYILNAETSCIVRFGTNLGPSLPLLCHIMRSSHTLQSKYERI